MPPQIHVTLIPEDESRARATPRWIVGEAFGSHDVAIFPARVGTRATCRDRGLFAHAFELQTGETPDEAAARAWGPYRRGFRFLMPSSPRTFGVLEQGRKLSGRN